MNKIQAMLAAQTFAVRGDNRDGSNVIYSVLAALVVFTPIAMAALQQI